MKYLITALNHELIEQACNSTLMGVPLNAAFLRKKFTDVPIPCMMNQCEDEEENIEHEIYGEFWKGYFIYQEVPDDSALVSLAQIKEDLEGVVKLCYTLPAQEKYVTQLKEIIAEITHEILS